MKKKTDVDVETRVQIWNEAEASLKEDFDKKTIKLEAKAEASKTEGFFQKMALDMGFNKILTYAKLYEVHTNKTHQKLGMTWEQFCETYVTGVSRRTVERIMKDLRPIFDNFSGQLTGLVGVPFNKIRYLGRNFSEKHDNLTGFEDGNIVIDGVKIPLSAENKDEIEAAIDGLKESHIRQKEDHEAKLKAKDRVLEEKERVIQKQEKDLAKIQRDAKARGFEPGEENFIQRIENLKTLLVGIEMDMDWRTVPQDPTPLMRAAYIETIGHAARVFRAYYDEATAIFGDPEMDDDYQLPEKKEAIEQ